MCSSMHICDAQKQGRMNKLWTLVLLVFEVPRPYWLHPYQTVQRFQDCFYLQFAFCNLGLGRNDGLAPILLIEVQNV